MDLSTAARRGDIHLVQELLSIGATSHSKNQALEEAAYNGHVEIVEMLLDAGADSKGGYALELSAKYGYIQIVELILAAGANLNNEEALEWAAANDHIQIVELLLLAGANIEVLPLYDQRRFNHLIPIYISIQEYLMLEPSIINIMELKYRYIVDIVSDKKYIVLK